MNVMCTDQNLILVQMFVDQKTYGYKRHSTENNAFVKLYPLICLILFHGAQGYNKDELLTKHKNFVLHLKRNYSYKDLEGPIKLCLVSSVFSFWRIILFVTTMKMVCLYLYQTKAFNYSISFCGKQ